MRITDYRKAFDFAQRHDLLGILHRWIVFFPGPVVQLLEKGKPTGLPKTFLHYPVFNQHAPVYHIRFLGNVIISKNQQYLRTQLSPQERAFFIYLALRAGTPRKSVLLDDLHRNFWAKSTKSMDLLLHLLASLKKKLRMPGHLLSVSSRHGEPRLYNRGVYFATDYDEFETLLTQARSLERAEEWRYAVRDYTKAFTLLRGIPFEKMYDSSSENMRSTIMNRVETEGIHFAKRCLEFRDTQEARKVLEKVASMIPASQEASKLLREVRS
jgi:hypothetical protein